MANNVTIPASGTGDATPKVATEQLADGSHAQLVKLLDGTAGSSTRNTPLTDQQLRASAVPVTDPSLSARYGGGKSSKTAQVTASGDTTIHTPAAGKKIRLYWVSAINDPDQSVNPRIIVKFGATELYRSYAISHWEIFDGPVDQSLVVNLDQAGDVAVTVHYQEI